jgi:midasin
MTDARVAVSWPQGPEGSVILAERGDTVPVPRHPGFRLFGAMNPANDAGKRDLPASVRARFTELQVGETTSREDLCSIVTAALAGVPRAPIDDVVDFFLAARMEADTRLLDSAGQKPQFRCVQVPPIVHAAGAAHMRVCALQR